MINLTTNFVAYSMPISFFIYMLTYILNNVITGVTLCRPNFFRSRVKGGKDNV